MSIFQRSWTLGAVAVITAGAAQACECLQPHHSHISASAEAGAASIPPVPRFRVENMDRTVDPRVDFYRFAAGGWEDRIQIPADKAIWGGFAELAERNWWNVRQLLEGAAGQPGAKGSAQQKVGDLFASALDEATINARGAEPLAAGLARIAAITTRDEVADELARQHLGLGGALFAPAIYADMKQSEINALYLFQGGLSLPDRNYYFEERFERERAALQDHMVALWVLTGEGSSVARAQAGTVFALERALAEKSKTAVERRDRLANYHKLTVAEATARWPALQLDRYFRAMGAPGDLTYVIVGQPEFLDTAAQLLADTALDDIKVYLQWHLLSAAAPYLAEPFERESFHFRSTVLRGTPAMEPRWQRAARVVDQQLGELLGQLFVAKHFPPAVKARLDEMIKHLKATFADRLAQLDWMTPATRERAVEKFARFNALIGYPEKWKDYSAVEVRRDDYFGNVERATVVNSRRDVAKIGQPVDRREFGLPPQTVNAYFDPTANQIVFLAGILQPPFFDAEADDALNYGAIGAVIGHEITHGFDDQGRRFDAEGNLADWWTAEDETEFKRRAQRLVDQFNSYEVLPGVFVQGELALGENIADLGGISLAYEAFQRSLKGRPRPAPIDGFTAEQRFFLAWAQGWRTKFRDGALKQQVVTGPHAPGFLRATGPLVNFAPFYEAFNIRPGDPMWREPEKRADIW